MTNKKGCKFLMVLLILSVILTILQPTPVKATEEITTEAICTIEIDYIDFLYNVINVLETINANSEEVNDEHIVNECSFTEKAVKVILCKVWDI